MKEETKHECKYDSLEVHYRYRIENDEKVFQDICVMVDCKCTDSDPVEMIIFCDTPILSARDNFRGWFGQVSQYFIQNDYTINYFDTIL